MAEYIKREAARELMYQKQAPLTEYDLDSIPVVDVEEVRHGKWLHVHVAVVDTTGDCSVCNTEAVWRTRKKPYSICPNCGTRMDGDHNDKS